jgi:hypothetical protein
MTRKEKLAKALENAMAATDRAEEAASQAAREAREARSELATLHAMLTTDGAL